MLSVSQGEQAPHHRQTLRHESVFPAKLQQLEPAQSGRSLIESECMFAACPTIERADKRICELSGSVPERDHCGKYLLLVLNEEGIRLQDSLNSIGDLRVRQTIHTIENPHDLRHRHHTDKTRIPFR